MPSRPAYCSGNNTDPLGPAELAVRPVCNWNPAEPWWHREGGISARIILTHKWLCCIPTEPRIVVRLGKTLWLGELGTILHYYVRGIEVNFTKVSKTLQGHVWIYLHLMAYDIYIYSYSQMKEKQSNIHPQISWTGGFRMFRPCDSPAKSSSTIKRWSWIRWTQNTNRYANMP